MDAAVLVVPPPLCCAPRQSSGAPRRRIPRTEARASSSPVHHPTTLREAVRGRKQPSFPMSPMLVRSLARTPVEFNPIDWSCLVSNNPRPIIFHAPRWRGIERSRERPGSPLCARRICNTPGRRSLVLLKRNGRRTYPARTRQNEERHR
jgi:hypothetical protein